MNDPTYVEAARVFAAKIIAEGGKSLQERFDFAFRTAVTRPPTEEESAVLQQLFEQQLKIYQEDTEAAMKLVAVGESPQATGLQQSEYAAWTAIASIILNLDETVSRE